MKTGYITTIGCLLLCSSALLWSCDRDDDHRESKHFRLTVKATDPDPENVKDNLYLYFFDGERKLEKVVKCALDVESDIPVTPGSQYTVIAFGYSKEMQPPTIPQGTVIEDAQIVLPTQTFANNVVADSPGDIFYGTFEFNAGCEDEKETIWIKRKVAALTITTRNLQAGLNTTDEDFSYVVRQTYGTLGFNGKLKGDKVSYHPKSYFTPTKHNLIAPMFYTHASQDEVGFCIDIYKGTSLIKSYCTDGEAEPMLLKEGKHTEVLIDFSNAVNDGSLDVTCVLKDWVGDNIEEGFD